MLDLSAVLLSISIARILVSMKKLNWFHKLIAPGLCQQLIEQEELIGQLENKQELPDCMMTDQEFLDHLPAFFLLAPEFESRPSITPAYLLHLKHAFDELKMKTLIRKNQDKKYYLVCLVWFIQSINEEVYIHDRFYHLLDSIDQLRSEVAVARAKSLVE
jgi:hypothetical protein